MIDKKYVPGSLRKQRSDLLQRGDSSAPLGQSGVLSHTVVRLMHTLWPGHCHCQLGHRKGGVGQSLSSLMSLQSLSPSQIQLRNTQFPLSQRKNEEGQVRGGQAWCSSLSSSQSGWPSHSQVDGIQLPSDWHWNSLSWWHIPGGLVAGTENTTKSVLTWSKMKENQNTLATLCIIMQNWVILQEYNQYLDTYDRLAHLSGHCNQTLHHIGSRSWYIGDHWSTWTHSLYSCRLKNPVEYVKPFNSIFLPVVYECWAHLLCNTCNEINKLRGWANAC